MSTILIDRRTAALLGELAAAPAGTGPLDQSAADGVALGVRLRGPLVENRRRVEGRVGGPASPAPSSTAATRPATRRVAGKSSAFAALTVRRNASAEARLRRWLRCECPESKGRRAVGAAAVAVGVRARRPRPGALHLTRRGRLAAVLLLLVVLTVAFSVGRVTSTAVGSAAAPGAEVVVRQGDTLWSIAERIAPNADPRNTAADLMAVNGLGSPSLEVGQHLRLP